MSAGHTHAVPTNQNEKVLWWALGLTSSFLVAEFAAGILLNSLALLSDAAHMFTDAAALGIALAAIHIGKRPPDKLRTYGYERFEILAAAFNAMLLFAVAMYILFEAVQRFIHPVEVQSVGMIWVASLGLVINFISMRLLTGGKDKSLNLKGAYLEVWSDMLGSIGVIAGALIIYFTHWVWVDTLVAVGIGLWVLPRTWVLLKESLNLLLEGVPLDMDMQEIEKAMLAVPNVVGVHDLHIWGITSGKNSLTAHIVHLESAASAVVIESIKAVLGERFSLNHTTLQCEIVPCPDAEECNLAHPVAEIEDTHEHSQVVHQHG